MFISKSGGGEFGGTVRFFVLGWVLILFGWFFVLGFFFFCKLLVQKKQEEKLEVVLFGNAAFILN